jgi:pyruvate dehydrogenase E2 component (dihydrolipoamide acetyltransferase)
MIEFRFPSLGADMDSGLLVGWLVKPGDEVHRGDIIAEVETDKGLVEVESWVDGRMVEFLVQPSGQPIAVGTPLALLEPLGAEAEEEPAAVPEWGAPSEPPLPEPVPEAAPPAAEPTPITPPVRHLAHQLGVDLSTVIPGSGGSITRDDIYRAAEQAGRRVKASPLARRTAEELGVDISAIESSRRDGLITADDVAGVTEHGERPSAEPGEVETVISSEDRLAAMRGAIARSMTRSKREIPHYYLGTRIDLDAATRWLHAENENRPIAKRILPAVLLLRATAMALREVPELNGYWIDEEFRPASAIHLGIAISLRGGGLVAPAIHDADGLDIDEMMDALSDLVARARSWRLRSSEMSAPTMTVTNLGDRGVETVFPVIIPPQVAMIGFGKITNQPVAVDEMLAVHPTVGATLAGDHRVTDGHRGGVLLATIDRLLQEPQNL